MKNMPKDPLEPHQTPSMCFGRAKGCEYSSPGGPISRGAILRYLTKVFEIPAGPEVEDIRNYTEKKLGRGSQPVVING